MTAMNHATVSIWTQTSYERLRQHSCDERFECAQNILHCFTRYAATNSMLKWNVQQSPRQQTFDIWLETRRRFMANSCRSYSWNIPSGRSKQTLKEWHFNRTHQLMGNNKHTVQYSIALLVCSREAGREANRQNAVWTGCMPNSQHNDTGNSNKSCENGGGMFKYLGTILANQNCFQSRLNSGNAAATLSKILFSRLSQTSIKNKNYNYVNLATITLIRGWFLFPDHRYQSAHAHTS